MIVSPPIITLILLSFSRINFPLGLCKECDEILGNYGHLILELILSSITLQEEKGKLGVVEINHACL